MRPLGIPWLSSHQDFMLSLLRAKVWSLVGELRSHKPHGVAVFFFFFFFDSLLFRLPGGCWLKLKNFLAVAVRGDSVKKGPGLKNKVFSQKTLNKGNMSHSNWRARNVRNTGLIILAGSYYVLGQISRPKYSRGKALKSRCSDLHGAVTAQVLVIFVGEQDVAGSPHANGTWNLESGPTAEVMLQN